MTDDERDKLRGALANVLSNASNYPERVQTRILGQDMGPLIDKVTDAVAGLYPVIAHKVATECIRIVESRYIESEDIYAAPVSALRAAFPSPTTPEGQNTNE